MKKNNCSEWIKEHKRQLAIVGIGAVTVGLVYLGINNREAIFAALKSLCGKETMPVKMTSAELEVGSKMAASVTAEECLESGSIDKEQMLVDIGVHIRNLHSGWQASAEKIAEAEKWGIPLATGQTLVDGYTRRIAAA